MSKKNSPEILLRSFCAGHLPALFNKKNIIVCLEI